MSRTNAKKRGIGRVLIAIVAIILIIWAAEKVIDRVQSTDEGRDHQPAGYEQQQGNSNVVNKGKEENTPELSSVKLYSRNAILVRMDDGKVLLDKRSEEKVYPASLTKMMTTIVAIEQLPDLQQLIRLSSDMFHELFEANASMAGFLPNEEVPAIDLLYGVMLPSGAESSIGLAEAIAGSEAAFVQLMNEKAEELGMKGTHFTNTTGLHDSAHYTTMKDLAILLEYALRNDTFREIFTTNRYSTESTNRHPEGITFYNKMFTSMEQTRVDEGEILGGKTGYTTEAGLCLASLANIKGSDYVLLTAGAKGDHNTKQYNISDAFAVYGQLGKG